MARKFARTTEKVVNTKSGDKNESKVKSPSKKRAKKKKHNQKLNEPTTADLKIKAEIGKPKSSFVTQKSGELDIKPDLAKQVQQELSNKVTATISNSAPDVKPDVILLKKKSIKDPDEQADELTKPVKNETVSKAKQVHKVTKTEVGEDKTPSMKWQKKVTKSEPTDDVYSDKNRALNQPDAPHSKMLNKPLHLTKSSGWSVPELLAKNANINYNCANKIVKLLKNGNNIHYIYRHYPDIIGSMTYNDLCKIKNLYTTIFMLDSKIMSTIKTLEKRGVLTDKVRREFESAESFDEFNIMYEPFKMTRKKTLAKRAIALELEQLALDLLNGVESDLGYGNLIQKDNSFGLEKVDRNICHNIAELLRKDVRILQKMRDLQEVNRFSFWIEVKKTGIVKSQKTSALSGADNTKLNHHRKQIKEEKFVLYYDFKIDVQSVKPHQTMAINRGEKYKILSVKIIIPDQLKFDLKRFVEELYPRAVANSKIVMDLFNAAFEEAFNNRFSKLISEKIRFDLTKLAEDYSIKIFAKNFEELLMQTPVIRGENILGIDPGFRTGCNCAFINKFKDQVGTITIYPNTPPEDKKNWENYGHKIRDLLVAHNCKVIALGNGTGCRETEKWLKHLYDKGIIDKNEVRYYIVSEQGASIYSCGPIAKKEFPKLDVNLISAVSIARRLADPLNELVKIEPKHLGLGMNQHDLNEKELSEVLNDIISHCVSYVVVDVNTASVALLRYVPGLTEELAQNIINYRLKHGPFKSRKELIKVKQIDKKTFQQCASFICINAETADPSNYDILDSTPVHPESYKTAEHIIAALKLKKCDIGKAAFIATIEANSNYAQYKIFADKTNQPVERVASIFEALQQDGMRYNRNDINKPIVKQLYNQTLTKITDLKVNDVVTGRVINHVCFGYFVDIGVGTNGLIHSSKLNGVKVMVGHKVEVVVINLDIQQNKIQLSLKRIW